jgi:hypothetical protein
MPSHLLPTLSSSTSPNLDYGCMAVKLKTLISVAMKHNLWPTVDSYYVFWRNKKDFWLDLS